MDILTTLWYLLLVTFPLGVLVRINVIPSAYAYPIDFVLAVLFVYTFLKNKKKIVSAAIFKPIALFVGFAFFSLILNIWNLKFEYVIVSFLYLVRFILYLNLLFVFSQMGKKTRKKALYGLSISGFVIVVLGVIQYFVFPYLGGLYNLGWDRHYLRIFSTFFDPNFVGAVFMLESLLLLGLFNTERNTGRLSKKNLIFLVMFFVTIGALFFTYSRSVFIAFFMSTVLYFALTKQKKVILGFLLIFLIGIFLIPKHLHSEGVDLLRTASVGARFNAYQAAFQIFSESPIWGIGFDTYRYAQNRHHFLDPKTWLITHTGAGVPNSFLLVLATTGIIGAILFLNLCFQIIRNVLKAKSAKNYYLVHVAICCFAAVLIDSLFENTFFYPSVMFFLFAILGIAIADR